MKMQVVNRLCFFILAFSSLAHSYSGSHAYNKTQHEQASVNAATGAFDFSYNLISTQGNRKPFELNLVYRFNRKGLLGLPKGWEFDLDYIDGKTANIHGQQWIIDPQWRDETLTASGLRYYNQHGTQFTDEITTTPIPKFTDQSYRYILRHKDGSLSYFSHQGLLVLKVDRFDNAIKFQYQHPITSLQAARLDSIVDNYGNKYQFIYAPNEMRLVMPDHREMVIYYDEEGVIKIVNPLNLYTKISYIKAFGHNLMRSIVSPSGLFIKLAYGSITYKSRNETKLMPVVNSFEKIDEATNNLLEQTIYEYSSENNFTGYPNYSLSSDTDDLMDSQDQSYRYWVRINRSDLSEKPNYHGQVFYYNFLHLPIEVHTLKEGKPYLKADYHYMISPFKYNRSTNYDKPQKIVKSLWSEAHDRFVETERHTNNYDRYGNKTLEMHEYFDRVFWYWKEILTKAFTYFPEYSLKQSEIKKDSITGLGIKKSYQLAEDKKSIQSAEIAFSRGEDNSAWIPWQNENYVFDKKGRKIHHSRQWLTDNWSGPKKTWKNTHYQFDTVSRQLTVSTTKPSGSKSKHVIDTRNNHKIKTITAMNEVWLYDYDALGRLTNSTDPLGNHFLNQYTSYQKDGANAV
ncbi:MAG: hypothetical protein OXE99_09870, partial [Cellvibrionales bacterium]|nr:hypothetical protein [Cellvibrionales bacterium]